MTSADAVAEPSLQVELLAADGRVERAVEIGEGPFFIGRQAEGLSCPDDDQMAVQHARLVRDGRVLRIEDTGEGSGVWLRVRGADGRPLESEDQLWLGAQILVVRLEDGVWQLRHHGPSGRLVAVHPVPAAGLFIGRRSDLVLDPEDTRLSRRHAQVVQEEGGLRFYDRGAHNGSFVRLTRPAVVDSGDEFRLATHRFRIAAPPEPAVAPPEETPTQVHPEPPPAMSAPRKESTSRPSLASRLRRLAGGETAGQEATSEPAPETNASLDPPPSEAPGGRLREGAEALGETLRGPAAGREGVDERSSAEALGGTADIDQEATVLSLPADANTDEANEADVGETIRTPRRVASGSEAATGADGATGEHALLVIDTDAESVSLEVEPGTTVLDAIRAEGIERGRLIDWECEEGGCGVCVVSVVEGADRLDPPDPASDEMKTIQITEQVAPDPSRYRLACLARVRGTVRVRRL